MNSPRSVAYIALLAALAMGPGCGNEQAESGDESTPGCRVSDAEAANIDLRLRAERLSPGQLYTHPVEELRFAFVLHTTPTWSPDEAVRAKIERAFTLQRYGSDATIAGSYTFTRRSEEQGELRWDVEFAPDEELEPGAYIQSILSTEELYPVNVLAGQSDRALIFVGMERQPYLSSITVERAESASEASAGAPRAFTLEFSEAMRLGKRHVFVNGVAVELEEPLEADEELARQVFTFPLRDEHRVAGESFELVISRDVVSLRGSKPVSLLDPSFEPTTGQSLNDEGDLWIWLPIAQMIAPAQQQSAGGGQRCIWSAWR